MYDHLYTAKYKSKSQVTSHAPSLKKGVFFRKHTQKTAKSLELVGWVRNTDRKTVEGVAQGREDKVAEMKKWLQTKGSPKSTIDRAVFKNEKTVSKLEFKDFVVRR